MGGETFQIPAVNRRWVLSIIGAILVLIILVTSFYQIGPDEVGVIKRFGAYVTTTQPGLHLKLPFGIETVTKVRVKYVFKEEFGFRTLKAGVRSQYARDKSLEESLMLTGDLNSAVVEWIVQYKVKDPVAFLFHVRGITKTIRDISEAVTRQVVGDRSVDEVIILSRREIALECQEKIQKRLDTYETGIDVVTVELKDVNPPDPVKPSFNEVNEAKQEKDKMVNEAWEAYNKAVPKAEGEAEKTIRQAEGYALNRVNRAQGDANKFQAIWAEYSRAKDVTRRRLYLEALSNVLPNIQKKVILDEDAKSLVPLLQLGKGGETK
ncbi:MAG: FtsH protease activity modulator HflK [Gemmatimonadota bacterium]|nr:MAG: FtsH protease activity modulator HflK [Gemmatimonadota bacterium]